MKGKYGTALVVDDESVIRDVARLMLEDAGYDVVTAGDGDEALTLFRADPEAILFVLLDRKMPGRDGAATARAMRTLRTDVPIVVTSGHREDESRIAEASAFVAKPFTQENLLAAVATALAS